MQEDPFRFASGCLSALFLAGFGCGVVAGVALMLAGMPGLPAIAIGVSAILIAIASVSTNSHKSQ